MSDLATTTQKIQEQAVQYRSPVSEALLANMGGAINFCLTKLLPVGTILPSTLTDAEFSAENGTADWRLCDGRDCSGTIYAGIKSVTRVPDFRGAFLRGRNNGRNDGRQNPDGEIALAIGGSDLANAQATGYQADEFKSHTHTYSDQYYPETGAGGSSRGLDTGERYDGNTFRTPTSDPSGGNETRSKNYTVNYFIKVN